MSLNLCLFVGGQYVLIFITFTAVLLAVALNLSLFVGSHFLFVGTHGSKTGTKFGTKYTSFRRKSFSFRRAIFSLVLQLFCPPRVHFHYVCCIFMNKS